jgi:hypothetical protein
MLVSLFPLGDEATLSNCGKPLKLQIPSRKLKGSGGQVNCLGYGHNSGDADNGQSAAKLLRPCEYGEGSETRWEWVAFETPEDVSLNPWYIYIHTDGLVRSLFQL